MEVSSKPDIYTAGKDTFFNDMLEKLDAKIVLMMLKVGNQ